MPSFGGLTRKMTLKRSRPADSSSPSLPASPTSRNTPVEVALSKASYDVATMAGALAMRKTVKRVASAATIRTLSVKAPSSTSTNPSSPAASSAASMSSNETARPHQNRSHMTTTAMSTTLAGSDTDDDDKSSASEKRLSIASSFYSMVNEYDGRTYDAVDADGTSDWMSEDAHELASRHLHCFTADDYLQMI
ncbi:hypothetical protein PYCC9005_000635 [Savitreella phatthalungensis]